MLWRLCGRRIEAFVLAAGWTGPLPKAMLETFFFLDGFYGIMEEKRAKEEAEEEAKKSKRN